MSAKCKCGRVLRAGNDVWGDQEYCAGVCTCRPADSAGPARRLVLTPASEIEPEPVVWAWEDEGAGRIPAGSVGLFAGREGTGKSSFLIWLTAKITTGTLPGSLTSPRPVIYVAVEDSWKYTIVPRLMASGADLTKVYRAEVQVLEAAPSRSPFQQITSCWRRPSRTTAWPWWCSTRSCRPSAIASTPT
jgi:hypothetical protein